MIFLKIGAKVFQGIALVRLLWFQISTKLIILDLGVFFVYLSILLLDIYTNIIINSDE